MARDKIKKQLADAILKAKKRLKKGAGDSFNSGMNFIKQKIGLTTEERARLQQETVGDVKAIQDLDNEKGEGDLRPSFFELGTEADTETPEQAEKERIKFAMFNHVDEGYGGGTHNPIYQQNKMWDAKVRIVDNPFPKTDLITPDQLAYYMSPTTSIKPYSVSYKHGGGRLSDQMLLRDIYKTAAKLHPCNAVGTQKFDIPLTNQNAATTNYRDFQRTNFVEFPSEGTTRGQANYNVLGPQESSYAGMSFSTGIWQTGISSTSFLLERRN